MRQLRQVTKYISSRVSRVMIFSKNFPVLLPIVFCCGSLLFTLFGTGQGDLFHVTERCCALGEHWFAQNNQQCLPSSPIPTDILIEDFETCSEIAKVCCIAKHQQSDCTVGQRYALSMTTCDDLAESPDYGSHAEECCRCCKLGRTRGLRDLSCYMAASYYSPNCILAYLDCCSQVNVSHAELPDSSEIDDSTEIDSTTTLSTTTEQTSRLTCREYDSCQHHCVEETPGSPRCICFRGYQLQSDDTTCQDIDECEDPTRCEENEECINEVGSFECRKREAGERDSAEGERESESEEENEREEENLRSNERNGEGSERDSDTEESDTEESDRESDEYSESEEGESKSSKESSLEVDSEKSSSEQTTMQEDCRPGYAMNSVTEECEDIDECAADIHTCNSSHQICENLSGAYICVCIDGYQYDIRTRGCQDVDECDVHGTHNCEPHMDCVNLPGSFQCELKTCEVGYRLNELSGVCEPPVLCHRGLRLGPDGNCIDIDECLERPGLCHSTQRCHNTLGSYVCRNEVNCGRGFQPNDAGTACQDINECETGVHDCNGLMMRCINRPGSYHCLCLKGYQLDRQSGDCEDINECMAHGNQVCPVNNDCINTPGSYWCKCIQGFRAADGGRNCIDIDECEIPDVCEYSCRNTWGSYQCTCREGYQLNDDMRTCQDMDECAFWEDRGLQLCPNQICRNTEGSYSCSCVDGYRSKSNGNSACEDIDECRENLEDCMAQDEVCINTRGGYKCETVRCPSGFKPVNTFRADNGGLICERLGCALSDIACFLNKTRKVQFTYISMPAFRLLPAPVELLQFRSTRPDVYPDMRLHITAGNDRRLFDVIEGTAADYKRGALRLIRPIEGPTEHRLTLRVENRNSYGTVIASQIVYITVFVSEYAF